MIASLGETADGQIVNINADFAANELVRVLKPYKIIFLTGTGGLLDGDGAIIDSINLSTEYDTLMAEPWLHSGMRLKIEQIKDLLDKLPLASSVSITRPAELAKELFTHKGSGTLIRRGERVDVHTDWSGIDQSRLRTLIEASFGRRLAADYFERTRLYEAYVSENYRAALILTTEDGIPVPGQVRGRRRRAGRRSRARGVAGNARRESELFWRSRHATDQPFYYAESDGCYKQPRWKVYWYGIDEFADIERCVEHCRERPATLEDEIIVNDAARPRHRVGFSPPHVRFETRRRWAEAHPMRLKANVGIRHDRARQRRSASSARAATPAPSSIRLIARHPLLDLAFVSSRELDGERVSDHVDDFRANSDTRISTPKQSPCEAVDAVILALPNGKAADYVQLVDARNSRDPAPCIVDLSADHRFDEPWYYGLPELTRKRATTARAPYQQPRLLRDRDAARDRAAQESAGRTAGVLRRFRLFGRRHDAVRPQRSGEAPRQPDAVLADRPRARARSGASSGRAGRIHAARRAAFPRHHDDGRISGCSAP